ncbi:MAG: TetR/AcrR family transcriptional regulator [Ignavibacteria bacterium]|nr:TetR/AcrR family transcriptional regulator [Ignavibacteria bacterium]
MNESIPRKERERVFRRNEIQTAASKLFALKGFNSTTLEEIAESAEFGKGTIYNYFQNKEEIYFSIIEDVLENTSKILEKSDKLSKSLQEFVKLYIDQIFNYCIENKFSYLIFVREIAHFDPIFTKEKNESLINYHNLSQKILTKQFKNALKEDVIKPFETKKVINFFIHVVFPYVHYLLLCTPVEEINIKAETDFISEILLSGMLSDKS